MSILHILILEVEIILGYRLDGDVEILYEDETLIMIIFWVAL